MTRKRWGILLSITLVIIFFLWFFDYKVFQRLFKLLTFEYDPKVVATQFMEDLVNGSLNPSPLNPGDTELISLGSYELDMKYQTFRGEVEAGYLVPNVKIRQQRYQGLEINQIYLTELYRTKASLGERSIHMGDHVTFAITLIQRPRGQFAAWESVTDGRITVEWSDLGILLGGWRVEFMTP